MPCLSAGRSSFKTQLGFIFSMEPSPIPPSKLCPVLPLHTYLLEYKLHKTANMLASPRRLRSPTAWPCLLHPLRSQILQVHLEPRGTQKIKNANGLRTFLLLPQVYGYRDRNGDEKCRYSVNKPQVRSKRSISSLPFPK